VTRLLLDGVLCAGCILLLIPAIVLLLETLAALLPAPASAALVAGPAPRTVILIPAHDEAGQIEETVRLLARDERDGPEAGPEGTQRILVIADNCSDQTAALAAAGGARVIERHDARNIGKGFAISYGLRQLDADPPEVVVLVDADCRVSAGGVATLARLAAGANRPVQAEYLLGAPEKPGAMAVVSALAVLLRNRVRARGLRRLGCPCLLTGSGMAFPWRVLRDAPETGDNLVEDMVMGIELALRGHPPLSCPDVRITSELPAGRGAGLRQRKRWEHGHLHTLLTYGPRLIRAGLGGGRPSLIGLGLDLMVPPLALLVTLLTAAFAVSAAAHAIGLASLAPAALSGAALLAVAVAVAVAWVGFGRRTLPLRYALFVPAYLLWKIPLYVGLAIRGKQKKWERTERAPKA
jgi:cellulose synthase/poly-beta-1,6-N-acetylglucosamine synthase-like glycosyltransferase